MGEPAVGPAEDDGHPGRRAAIRCTAGPSTRRRTAGYITNNVLPAGAPVTMYTGSLHMHTRGRKANAVDHPRRRHQGVHARHPALGLPLAGRLRLQAAQDVRPGDQLYLECHFDNSDSTMERNWGEGTDDEMCLGGFYVTP